MVDITAFYGQPVAALNTMLTAWQAALTAIATTGQSYSIAGRTLTRANLSEVSQMVAAIQAALTRANGTVPTQTYGYFSSQYPGCNTNSP